MRVNAQKAKIEWNFSRLDSNSNRLLSTSVCGCLSTVKALSTRVLLMEKDQIAPFNNRILDTTPVYRLSKGQIGHSSSSSLLENNCPVDWNSSRLDRPINWTNPVD